MKCLTGRELARLLEQNGWRLARTQGSHHIYVRDGSTVRISVPIHANRPLKRGLLRHLLKAAGVDPEGQHRG